MHRLRIIGSTVLIILIASGLAWMTFVLSNRHFASVKQNQTCSLPAVTHYVTIEHNVVSPSHTDAQHCDRLTIVNKDDATRLIAFGVHDRHIAYDGITERALKKGSQLTVMLKQTGSFHFHDHLQNEAAGTFTVAD
jgi:hypothetical protein